VCELWPRRRRTATVIVGTADEQVYTCNFHAYVRTATVIVGTADEQVYTCNFHAYVYTALYLKRRFNRAVAG